MRKILSLLPFLALLGASPLIAKPSDPLMGIELKVADKPVIGDLYPARKTVFKGGVTGLADVIYSTVPGFRPMILDLYLPPETKEKKTYPVIVYIHGGGWVAGHTRHSGAIDHFPDFMASLAKRGYVVASVEYRLSGEAPFPAQIDDVRAALRFLRSNAAAYHINPDKVGIWGGSAGGHLAGLAAASCGASFGAPAAGPSECTQAFVGWYGVYDFTTIDSQRTANLAAGTKPDPTANGAIEKLLKCEGAACADAMAKASPVTYVDKSDPPMLLIAGDKDQTVPYQQSVEMNDRLKAAGVTSELIIIPDVDHSFIGKTPASTTDATQKAVAATIGFFDKHLK
jgi:acetyl esterase/lipase